MGFTCTREVNFRFAAAAMSEAKLKVMKKLPLFNPHSLIKLDWIGYMGNSRWCISTFIAINWFPSLFSFSLLQKRLSFNRSLFWLPICIYCVCVGIVGWFHINGLEHIVHASVVWERTIYSINVTKKVQSTLIQ